MKRFGKVIDGLSSENVYPLYYDVLSKKIVGAIEETGILVRLIEAMQPELRILYILHTTRGEGAIGRYESPDLTVSEVVGFIDTYQDFLSSDCRFDIWIHSIADKSLVVFDRHNLLHCYGNVELFEAVFVANRYSRGKISVPAPHEHYYRKEFDEHAKNLLTEFDWTRTDLRQEDFQ